MKGSVIKRMYAGFLLIIVMFAITISMVMEGMNQINSQFETVSTTSLPLVTLSNQTSVGLLSADKSFKDFITTQDTQRMDEMQNAFIQAEDNFQQRFHLLKQASQSFPHLEERIEQLNLIEQRYFSETVEAMNNYQQMFEAQANVIQSSRRFQRLHSELNVGMKNYVDDQDSVSVKMLAKSYFLRLQDAEVITSDALASTDLAFIESALNKNRKAVTHLNDSYRGLSAQIPRLKQNFDGSVSAFTRDVGQRGGVLEQHYNYLTSKEALYANIVNLATEVDNAMAILNSFNEIVMLELDIRLDEAGNIYSDGLIKVISITLVVTMIALAIGYHIAQSVRQPLTRILQTLEDLTAGDMTQRIEIKTHNEFSRVGNHINSLADNLHNVLVQLNNASDNLTQTASHNQETSQQAQEQLNTQREQTASVATAMKQMSHSVQEVAQSAQSSLVMVQQVETASESGRQVMNTNISTINQLESRLNESVEAVNKLQQMSSQIGSILDVIRNIAEQTNLLALNAAIEAARAGDQGRGFAVVADEVRVLAQRTTQSTSEIESMISNLQSSSKQASNVIQGCMSEMDMSVEQASHANAAMEEIQSLIIEITQMSTHISQAASEQSETSEVIAYNIADINNIADISYQAMSSIAQTSTNLTNLAQQQNQLVHRFTL
ncbi:chemotaxis protein [Vibrio sp. 10N.286.49.B3]|uniref:methyl-accepting chemotaxis protein n=1 Tax=Vibrio sp. 10N.286.49.B3 TaxID=1880855 RepID=UPI000C83B440|nr:methyl-accepting chemotaxis protein [Vibrio sp. 10N.286.49.B3]PMH45016.1 chemotaxis protein [Vibrio sp. 10N.286.49.B3]